MKIYFDNPEYDGQFLRALDYAPTRRSNWGGLRDRRADPPGRHDELV
jgi:hypothetical protein